MGTTRKRAGAKAVAAMILAMAVRPQTYADLVKLTGLSQPTISAWIREMRNTNPKLVWVGRWDDDTRGIPCIPAFMFGIGGMDMPRPPGKPPKQRVAEYRQRKAGGAS